MPAEPAVTAYQPVGVVPLSFETGPVGRQAPPPGNPHPEALTSRSGEGDGATGRHRGYPGLPRDRCRAARLSRRSDGEDGESGAGQANPVVRG